MHHDLTTSIPITQIAKSLHFLVVIVGIFRAFFCCIVVLKDQKYKNKSDQKQQQKQQKDRRAFARNDISDMIQSRILTLYTPFNQFIFVIYCYKTKIVYFFNYFLFPLQNNFTLLLVEETFF